MRTSAPFPKIEVLITDVSSYLGANLAKNLLGESVAVYGIGRHHFPKQLLAQKHFTLLDIELSQPLPTNLPRFDVIFHIFAPNYHAQQKTSPILRNLLNLCAKGFSKVVLILPVESDPNLIEFLLERAGDLNGLLSFHLIGDIYGPWMNLGEKNILGTLISQAAASDKIILKNDGQDILYPSYISDIVKFLTLSAQESETAPKNNLEVVCSSDPQTALNLAYTLQKVVSLSLGRDIGLYFDREPGSGFKPSFQLHVHRLPGAVQPEEGFALTLRSLAPVQSSTMHQKLPGYKTLFTPPLPMQQAVPKDGKLAKIKNIKPKIGRLGHRPKIPHGLPHSKFKTVLLAASAVVILFIAKGTWDTTLGLSDLKSAKAALETANFKQAALKADSASGHLKKAQGKIETIVKPLSLVFPHEPESVENALTSLVKSAQSITALARGGEAFSQNIAKITTSGNTQKLDIETPQVNFKAAADYAAEANLYASLAAKDSFFKKSSQKLQVSTQTLNNTAAAAYQLTNLLPYITGTGSRTYLLLLQNNTELRPGGGFIGNVGLVEFESGRLKNVSVEDVYNIDGQLKEKIEPPPQLKDRLGVQQFYLRDSNWSPDFAQNASLARDFFKKETGKNVDGTVALDLSFMEELLKATGSIKLQDYDEEINSENLFDRGEYYSEIGFFPGSTQKKDFFGALSRALINRLIQTFSDQQSAVEGSVIKLVEVLQSGLSQKHLMLNYDDSVLASFVQTQGYNHPLPPINYNPADDSGETRDFLALSEANVGANKVNRYIERKISYDMTIGRDADLIAKLTISYTNNSQAETWPGGKYVNYLRIYVPNASTLTHYQNGTSTDTKEVTAASYGNLTVFSAFVEVPVKSTKEVTFTYRIPKNIKLETAPTYSLYVQKQPGTGLDPFTFTFHLPNYLEATKLNGEDQNPPAQNLELKTTLETDREFTVEVKKK